MEPRTGICLACRTALFPGEACDLGCDHPVVDLAGDEGRRRLTAAVWGSQDELEHGLRVARRAGRAARAVGFAGFAAGFSACWWLWPDPMLSVVAGVGSMLGAGSATERALRRRGGWAPHGAVDQIPEGTEVKGPRGRVEGESGLMSPASGLECVAFSLELHLVGPWGQEVMLRDAITTGFEIALESGGFARVPAGRLRIIGPMEQVIDFDNHGLEDHLRSLDRGRDPGRVLDPLEYNVVAEVVLVAGDRIQLVSTFEPEVNSRSGAGPGSYRDAAPSVLTPRGTPLLRLLT